MSIVNKLQQIIHVQTQHSGINPASFNDPINDINLKNIEQLLGEALPDDFLTLYRFADGQQEKSAGIFFGEKFMSSKEITDQLTFSKSLIKPEINVIENPQKSDELLKKIIDFYISKTIKRNLFGIKQKWYKIEFSCGPDSFGGPYLYSRDTTQENEREIVEIDSMSYDLISNTIKEIHNLEKEGYNWDNLEFIVYSTGEYKVDRTFYDFDNQLEISSTPDNAIRKKYFHYKWLPIFSDYSGNYIGIDMDPDINGSKGQVIIFGRDEQKMIVLGNSMEEVFDLVIDEINKPGNKLLNSNNHLHDILKDILY
jgi:cell wall assembly regulator SMI1